MYSDVASKYVFIRRRGEGFVNYNSPNENYKIYRIKKQKQKVMRILSFKFIYFKFLTN